MILHCAAAQLDMQLVYDFINDHIKYEKDIREMYEEERQGAKEREKRTRNEDFYRKNKIEQNYCLNAVSWLRE